MKLVKEFINDHKPIDPINESMKAVSINGTPLIIATNDNHEIGIKNIETNKIIVFNTKYLPELLKGLLKIK